MVYYSLLGGFIGFISGIVIGSVCDISDRSDGYFNMPSNRSLFTFLMTVMGGGVGFAYGSYRFGQGTHPLF